MYKIIFYFALCIFISSCGTDPTTETVENRDTTAVGHEAWSYNATIYEVNIRQYTPEGTFNAFAKDMPRLKDMGVKILWLMPVHPIGEKNRKGPEGSYYSVKDYRGVNPEFGTLEDFRSLVNRAHELDMKVIIDWVANHSAFDNVWTEQNRDWYNLDSLGNLQPPEGTDWWDVADLDYDNPEMRAAMIDAMKYWVTETGIDGFRCDVASFVPVEFWEAAHDSLEAVKPDIFMLAEAEYPVLQEKAFDMGYAWEFMHIMNGIAKGDMELSAIDEYMAKEDTNFAADDYRMYFTTNHDENSWNGTVMERYGADRHRAFAVLAFTIDGMPLVYSGQEAGLNRALKFFDKDSIDWGDISLQDFYSKLLWLNRENEALWNGTYGGDFRRLKTGADDRVYAFIRTKGEHRVITIVNLSDEPAEVKMDAVPEGEFKSLFGNGALEEFKTGVTLAPGAYHVFTRS